MSTPSQSARSSQAPEDLRRRTFEQIEGYCLSLRTTPKGNLMVDRSQWVWLGDDVGTANGAPVGGPFRSREAASAFASSYCDENPGCLTADRARERFMATVAQGQEEASRRG